MYKFGFEHANLSALLVDAPIKNLNSFRFSGKIYMRIENILTQKERIQLNLISGLKHRI